MDHRRIFDQTFYLEVEIALGVFAAVVLTWLFAIVHYRARRGHQPSKKSKHSHLEIGYAMVVAGLAMFLLVNSISQNAKEDKSHGDPKLTIVVTGFQWCWQFHYVATPVTVIGNCIDGHIPTLVVPASTPVQYDVTSNDVVHSMWVPHLRFKMDAFPHYINKFIAVVRTLGTYPGRCAEFCGPYHFAMAFNMKVVTPAAFKAWLATAKAHPGRYLK